MPNKRYTAFNRQRLMLSVKLPQSERTMTITFTEGYSLNSEAYFFTNDPVLQETLESDPRFNESYRLTEIEGVPIAEYEARKEIAARPDSELKAEVTESTRKTFVNLQAARDFLNSEHKVPFHLMSNKAKLLEKAKELGIDVILETDNKQ